MDPASRNTNPKALRQIAAASGAEAFSVKDVDKISDVLRRMAADIRHTYTLGYISTTSPRDGTFRSVRVVVQPPDGPRWLIVRARLGYPAPKASIGR